ncbi:MAG: fumarate hydratase class II [Halieaceae bacterium]|jgi:fumarate hydratase class II
MTDRVERDSLGEVRIPRQALYGPQTQRAIENFPISGQTLPTAFITALLQVKRAAALANAELEQLDERIARAIVNACDELLADAMLMDHFPVDVFQTGSGTSSNMNANEVIATLASRGLGQQVDPNDHVNCSQSSNDVIPTAIQVSAVLSLEQELLPALKHLELSIREKAGQVSHYLKTGRTHLMDAMPVSLGQSLLAWADQIAHCISALQQQLPELLALGQGGTAVGTGVNAHRQFAAEFCLQLATVSGIAFIPAANPFTRIGSQDVAVALSGTLKLCAVALTKIANDLRWMNSGPLAGLGEIELEALQPGSSIMPGKVNPVIPESVAMVAAQVIGNDTTITLAGQSGNFELNVMLPLLASNLLHSMRLLANSSRQLADRAILTFTVNEQKLQASLAQNPILVTALNSRIGYARSAEIAKRAYREGRAIIDVAVEETDIERDELARLLDPARLVADSDS